MITRSDIFFFFFNDTATTEIYTLSLHDALPISTFANLAIDKVGTGYTLTATGAGSATSTAFNITVGTATQLVFSVQPSTTPAGAAITPAGRGTAQGGQGETGTGVYGESTGAVGEEPGNGERGARRTPS